MAQKKAKFKKGDRVLWDGGEDYDHTECTLLEEIQPGVFVVGEGVEGVLGERELLPLTKKEHGDA